MLPKKVSFGMVSFYYKMHVNIVVLIGATFVIRERPGWSSHYCIF